MVHKIYQNKDIFCLVFFGVRRETREDTYSGIFYAVQILTSLTKPPNDITRNDISKLILLIKYECFKKNTFSIYTLIHTPLQHLSFLKFRFLPSRKLQLGAWVTLQFQHVSFLDNDAENISCKENRNDDTDERTSIMDWPRCEKYCTMQLPSAKVYGAGKFLKYFINFARNMQIKIFTTKAVVCRCCKE